MTHNKHVIDGINKDVQLWPGCTLEEALDYYLGLTDGWSPYNPDPVWTVHEGVRVIRDDMIVGTKARAGDLLMSRIPNDTVVYCQPRLGLAGVSLLDAAAHHGKKIVLFMPACERISLHQACCIERGAIPIFERIAAMPNLNLYAKRWADDNGAYFVPLGLKHELTTAAIIHAARKSGPIPDECYVATSTGVLTRALQIAWPKARFVSVCVSRNMQAGELGRAEAISHPMAFGKDEKEENLPPFPTVPNYDGKTWSYIPKDIPPRKDRLMWNVGQTPVLQDETVYGRVDSNVKWKKDRETINTATPI